MSANYRKLWQLLNEKDMKKKDLRALSGLSTASMAKLAKNQNVNADVLVRVCKALDCDIGDIMEVTNDN